MATTARFGPVPRFQGPGATRGTLEVTFDAARVIRLVDEVTNKFRGGEFQRGLASVHERAAHAVAQGMVNSLQESVRATGRRQRGTQALERSLLDERNVKVTANQFLVGVESWLESSPAKLYYRRIEKGDPHVFDVVGGALFTNDFGRFSRPWSPGGKRPAPAGYKHVRMPQRMARGALIKDVGPFPAYRYSRGGVSAMRKLQMADMYKVELASRGINLSKGAFK